MVSRREFLQVGAAAGAIAASNGLGPLGRAAAQQKLTQEELLRFGAIGTVTVLHMADLHAQLMPTYFREPSINLGVGDAAGWPPHITGADYLNWFGIAP